MGGLHYAPSGRGAFPLLFPAAAVLVSLARAAGAGVVAPHLHTRLGAELRSGGLSAGRLPGDADAVDIADDVVLDAG